MKKLPLIEKHRPKEFSEVVGVLDIDKIQKLIETPEDLPNLLFYGPQGTGKTTVAKIMIEKLKPIDCIRLNGSDTTGVDTIRDKVYNFMTSRSSVNGKPKLIWIEEFDYLSHSAFAALRSMIEQYIRNARFICTCNYIKKVPDPIQSRFSLIEFSPLNSMDMMKRIKEICSEEKIKVSDDTLKEIIENNKGDLRAVINTVQRLSSNEDKSIKNLDYAGMKNLAQEVYDLLLENKWSQIRYEIPQRSPDYNKLLVEIDDLFFKSDIDVEKKAKINEIIAHGMAEMSLSFSLDICFAAICSKIIKVI